MSGASAWMPLYIGDYLGDTQRLTTEQHGAYLLLLMDYWRNGPPPAEDAVLAQIARLSPAAWRKIKAPILCYFRQGEGQLHHSRVDRELAKATENQDRRSAKAKKAADARWHSSEDATGNAPSIPQALPQECPPPSPSSVTSVTAAEPAAEDPVKAVFDLGVSILAKAGKSEQQARTLVGRWRRDHGDASTLEALLSAREKTDPAAWIEGRFAAGSRQDDALIASIDRKYAAGSMA